MAEPENAAKSDRIKIDFARECRLQLRALNAQYSIVGGLYQLAGEYAALAEKLLEELLQRDAEARDARPPEPHP